MSVLPIAAAVLIIVASGVRLHRRSGHRAAGLRAQQRTVDVLRGLVGELQAGSSPSAALAAALDDDDFTDTDSDDAASRAVAQAARAPTDLEAAALLRAGPTDGLRALGACWRLSARCGTPLADASQRLAAVATRRSVTAAEVTATLAGPRLTGRLLAGLPVAGLLLGGRSAPAVLVGTGLGRSCLVVGVLLDAVGLLWIDQLTDAPTGPTGGTPRRVRARPRWAGRRPPPEAPDELALLADLVAAGLGAGLPVADALAEADAAVPGPRRHLLGPLRRAVLAGLPVSDGQAAASLPAGFVRAVERSGRSGARLARQLGLLADDARAAEDADSLARARRVGVLAVLPLGLCCLPAFMVLSVVPLAVGLLRGTSL
ncbi:MAG: tight adherence protein [Frankiaceae bacterium]|nr:tight adherence protein [Frankiaceae bacterium]